MCKKMREHCALQVHGSGTPAVVPTEVALVCPRQQAPKSGQEVTISYGDKSNEMLLMSYGMRHPCLASCRDVLCCAVPCRAVPCHAVPCRAVPCRAMLCCPIWSGMHLSWLSLLWSAAASCPVKAGLVFVALASMSCPLCSSLCEPLQSDQSCLVSCQFTSCSA